jgi:hypothetical protein
MVTERLRKRLKGDRPTIRIGMRIPINASPSPLVANAARPYLADVFYALDVLRL